MKPVLAVLSLCAWPLLAQFPGQYPGGNYPPGTYPPGTSPNGRYPTGQIPGGRGRQQPQQGRTQEQTRPKSNTPVVAATTGMLRRTTGSYLVIEADDHRIIWYRLTEKTTYQKSGKDADLKSFALGDRLNVEHTADDQDRFTAVSVTWQTAGTSADRAAAAETWDLPNLAGMSAPAKESGKPASVERAPGDERPVLRRANSQSSQAPNQDPAAPTQQASSAPGPALNLPVDPPADEEPVDTRPTTMLRPPDPTPDQDDPGKPVLRRGTPAPKRPVAQTPQSGGQSPSAPVLLTKAPDPAPRPAPTQPTSSSVPFVDRPSVVPQSSSVPFVNQPSIVPQEDNVIEKARQVAAEYAGSLPNFFAQQITTRYQTENAKQGWDALDIVTADVAYEDGRESYKNIKVGNKAVNKSMDQIEGTRSTGEFATMAESLLDPGTAAVFRRSGQDTIHGRSAIVFKYEVPRERSRWRIESPSQLYYPSYRGSVWFDKETGRVLRIEQEARNMPSLFPFDTLETTGEYDFVRLGG